MNATIAPKAATADRSGRAGIELTSWTSRDDAT